jgi:uncharacterized alpha/beta hydrolase family protein
MTNGSTGRFDILTFEKGSKKGFMIDPTVRFEIDVNQPESVNLEKITKYTPAIMDLLEKYQLNEIEIIGLFVGARGTISNLFENFRKRFQLPKKLNQDVALAAIKGSAQLLHNHLHPKMI